MHWQLASLVLASKLQLITESIEHYKSKPANLSTSPTDNAQMYNNMIRMGFPASRKLAHLAETLERQNKSVLQT